MPLSRRPHQGRRAPRGFPGVHVGAVIEQQRHRLDVAGPGRHHEHGFAVEQALVRVRSRVEQALHDGRVAVLRGQRQRRRAVAVGDLRVGTGLAAADRRWPGRRDRRPNAAPSRRRPAARSRPPSESAACGPPPRRRAWRRRPRRSSRHRHPSWPAAAAARTAADGPSRIHRRHGPHASPRRLELFQPSGAVPDAVQVNVVAVQHAQQQISGRNRHGRVGQVTVALQLAVGAPR